MNHWRDKTTSTSPALSRRGVLRLLFGTATVALAAACAPAAPATPSTGSAAATPASASAATGAAPSTAVAAAAQPRRGGTLRVAVPADISSLDGHTSSSILGITQSMAYDRLVAYDAAATRRPMLAESWEVSPDYKVLKLNLRQGVQWHSGRDFTSDDVKWNLLRGQDPKAATGSYVNQAGWFPDIETPDKYTVVLRSDVSRPAIFDYFNVLNLIDKQTVEAGDVKTNVVGTGPYRLTEWVQGDHLSYERNKNYWRADRPYLDGITIGIIRDLSAMSTQLEAGAQDAIYGPNINEFLRFKDDGKYRTLVPPGQLSGMAMGVNTLVPPLDNRQFRQALNYAVDRDRLAQQIYRGLVKPQFLPWNDTSLAYEAAKENPFKFDLDKAASLMKAAGVSSAELDFLPSPNTPEWELAAQIYQSDLAKIGIKLNLVKLDQAAWLSQVNTRKYNGFWGANMAIGTGEPVSGLSLGRATDPKSNNEGYQNDAYTQLIEAAASEPDTDKRRAIYAQINDIFVEDCFVMVVSSYPPKMVTTSKVHGLVTEESMPTYFFLDDVWLEP
jgi:peptide/nickel transport system substrate-binding protein